MINIKKWSEREEQMLIAINKTGIKEDEIAKMMNFNELCSSSNNSDSDSE